MNEGVKLDLFIATPENWGCLFMMRTGGAPVNSSTVGKEVDFKNTRNYTAMQIKPSPLDAFFV